MKHLLPIHPGEILREEFMVPLGISVHALAERMGVPETLIEDIAGEESPITDDIAVLLGRELRTSSGFWINLQSNYDMRKT